MEITILKKKIFLSQYHPLNQGNPDQSKLERLARYTKKWERIAWYRDENNNLVIHPID